MSYAKYDFSESLNRANIQPGEVSRVIAAWGQGSGMGEGAPHFKFHEEGISDWTGGFLMALKAGGYVYVTGWCDYTGWGCQDGVEVFKFDAEPTLTDILKLDQHEWSDYTPAPSEWDLDPVDLNRWLADPVEVY